jgi:hypothetical protein
MTRHTHATAHGPAARALCSRVLAAALLAAATLTLRAPALHAQEDVIKPVRTATALEEQAYVGPAGSTGPRPQQLSALMTREIESGYHRRGLYVYWTGTDGASSCGLLRGTSSTGPWQTIGSGCTLSARRGFDGAPEVGGTKYYSIAVGYPNGTWGLSDPIRVELPAWHQGIANLTATSPVQGTVVLRWTADPEAVGYTISRNKGSETRVQVVNDPPLTATTFTDTGLWNGATYTYVVHGVYPERRIGNTRVVTVGNAYVNVTIAP